MPEDILGRIHGAGDVKELSPEESQELAEQIRTYIIDTLSVTGGHLASNLGVVELTIALFRVFSPPEDKIIWDVGHQAYTHKILSGRKDALPTLRQHGGLSGFPKSSESDCDPFDTGHSSTSISAGLGIARARDLEEKNFRVISVIGDGALSGGMALEALNNASGMKTNFIIVLNDNSMSIAPNVGGMSDYLNSIRTAKGYTSLKKKVETHLGNIPYVGSELVRKVKNTKDSLKKLLVPGSLFEDMGVTYLGPVDGHDIQAVERALRGAAKMDHAVLVHVVTKKGKGYAPAEEQPEQFHGIGAFDRETGYCAPSKRKSYTSYFSDALCRLAEEDDRVVAVTAAMPDGTGLTSFAAEFPDRFFDVGIAEGHGVTFAAGMASQGLKPVMAVYSSFLQRGFDQLVHDVGLQKLPVIFAVDRGGLVGRDGETHQGIFDLSYLSLIPGMTVMAPKNGSELQEMLRFALSLSGPVAIRYPRGSGDVLQELETAPIEYGKGEVLKKGTRVCLLALGSMVDTAWKAARCLNQAGIDPTVVNMRFAKPIDEELTERMAKEHELLVTLEENVAAGGFGSSVLQFLEKQGKAHPEVLSISLPDSYVEHGDTEELKQLFGLDAESIAARIQEALKPVMGAQTPHT